MTAQSGGEDIPEENTKAPADTEAGMTEEIKQHCDCGNDTYHVKTTEDRSEVWAACADCGRPTAVMEDGMEKQRQWLARNDG